jgi:biopolymer transport protein ExbD
MKLYPALCVGFIGIAFLGGCGKQPAAAKGPHIKIAVYADGRITADGSPATIGSLKESFKKLSKENGEVWYYREAATREPPAQAMQVMQAVVEAGLPIRLSTRPDYSDSVGPDGK